MHAVVVGAGPRFVSQPALLEMLVAEAGKHASFRLERGFTVRDVLREGDRVIGVRGDSPEGTREVSGDFVIGTDGRASVLRKRFGLDRPMEAQRFDVVWFKVPMPDFLGAQGINIALRDTLVAANHLGPPLARGAAPPALDAAARRVQEERAPEVEAIQRLQALPPRVLFQYTRSSRFFVRRVAPLLARTGLAALLFGVAFRRFANGTTRVKLDPNGG